MFRDAAGNLTVQDDPRQNRHVRYYYDGLNRLTKKCYMNSDYAAGSPLACVGGAVAQQIDYYYDKPSDPHGRGRLWYVDDPAGGLEVEDYDRRGQELSVRRIIDTGGVTTEAVFQYGYTNSGDVKAVVYPGGDGEYVLTEYNAVGQPTGLAGYTGWPPALKDRYVQSVHYDLFGRVTMLQHGNGWEPPGSPPNYDGVKETRTYYGKQQGFRLSGLGVRRASTDLMKLSGYGYNPRGQLTAVYDDVHSGAATNQAAYVYDGYGRLTLYWNGYQAPQAYQYDEMGNIVQKGGLGFSYEHAAKPHRVVQVSGLPGGPRAFQYDRNGNRTQNHDGQTYEYDHEDRLVEVDVAGGEPVTFHYDAEGGRRARVINEGIPGQERMTRYFSDLVHTTDEGVTTRRYFLGGALIASRAVADVSWQMAAGPALGEAGSGVDIAAASWGGRPVLVVGLSAGAQTAAASAATVAVLLMLATALRIPRRRLRVLGLRLHGGQVTVVLALFVAGSATPWPLLLRPARAQPAAAETVHHYHTDHLGSVQMITDEDGNIVEQIRYYPYGEIRGRFGAAGNPLPAPSGDEVRYEFTGHETELNTGLIYAGARFLDPVSGMFLTQDPAAQYLNPYAYGPWDPVNGTDPTGMIFGPILGYLFANLWWIAPVAGAVASFAQALANGAGFTQALGAAAVGAGIGLVTGGILGGIGEAITNEALKSVYATALIAAGVGNTAHGFAEGQAITASVGAAMLALGLVAGLTQGGTGKHGIADPAANPTPGEYVGDAALAGEITRPPNYVSAGTWTTALVQDIASFVRGVLIGGPVGIVEGTLNLGKGIVSFDVGEIGLSVVEIGTAPLRYGSYGGLRWGEGAFLGGGRATSWLDRLGYAAHDVGFGRGQFHSANSALLRVAWTRHDLGFYGQVHRVLSSAVFRTHNALLVATQ